MTTVASARPGGLPAKPKRPVPPTLHTSPNGTYPTSSPSPSLTSTRLPPGSQGPTSAGSGLANGNTTPNGTGLRIMRRKDSQKLIDGNKPRIGRPPLEPTSSSTPRPTKRANEPFVRTTQQMLKKYCKSQPSFIIHLHPQYFRFDQQDGSFSYNSPMRALLEHIKNQTVPSEMLEELHASGIKFYESCLIVQVHDHRNSTNGPTTSSGILKNDRSKPFSMHNYNEYITPSPYVEHPSISKNRDSKKSKDEEEAREKQAETNEANQGPRIFTTVLFPTAMTFQEDLMAIAVSRDANTRKQATTGQPPAKKQKIQMSNKKLQAIEAETILATAPPLFLDPVADLDEMKQLYGKLADPLCNRLPPAPKSRKRTVAELAADEALLAGQQSFLLTFDERLAPNAGSGATAKTIVAEAEALSNATEARFERFKVLEKIKEAMQERKERENEARILEQQRQMTAVQQQQAQQRAKMEQEAQIKREMLAKQQEMIRNKQAQGMPQQVVQQNQSGPMQMPTGPAHPGQNNQLLANAQLAGSQAAHSSPVVRQMTPQNMASPAMGMMNRPQAVPMAVSGSNQGAGSPPRPGSAIPHGHPGAVPMIPQRSQQPPSRNGTPAMANGTPRMQQGTPVIGNATPNPRITQASPTAHAAATPIVANGMLSAAHMNGGPQFTPQQQQQILLHQQQQAMAQKQQMERAAMMQAVRERNHMHGAQPMSQQQMQAMAQAQLRVQQQREQQQMNQRNVHETYQAHMAALQQQMGQNAQNRAMINGTGQAGMQAVSNQAALNEMIKRSGSQVAHKIYSDLTRQLAQRYGGEANVPAHELEAAKQTAMQQARLVVSEHARKQQAMLAQQQHQQQQQQLHHQQQQQQMLAHMQRTGQMGGQMNGMGGMNGM